MIPGSMNRLTLITLTLSLCSAVALVALGCDSTSTSAPSVGKSPDTASPSATTAVVAASSAPDTKPSSAPDTPAASASSTASAAASGSATARTAASAPSSGSAKPEATASAKPETKEDNLGDKKVEGSYAAWLQGKKEYVVGQQSTVSAVVVAKGDYKCNAKYPFKFKTGGGSGVTYPIKTVRNKSYSKARTTVSVPFVPTQAGQVTVAGTFYFPVCTEEKCKFGKQAMSLTVNAVAK